jgi:hypothetical protein
METIFFFFRFDVVEENLACGKENQQQRANISSHGNSHQRANQQQNQPSGGWKYNYMSSSSTKMI